MLAAIRSGTRRRRFLWTKRPESLEKEREARRWADKERPQTPTLKAPLTSSKFGAGEKKKNLGNNGELGGVGQRVAAGARTSWEVFTIHGKKKKSWRGGQGGKLLTIGDDGWACSRSSGVCGIREQ